MLRGGFGAWAGASFRCPIPFGVDVDLALTCLEPAAGSGVLQKQPALFAGKFGRVQCGARAGLQFLMPILVAHLTHECRVSMADDFVPEYRTRLERSIGLILQAGGSLADRQGIDVRPDQ